MAKLFQELKRHNKFDFEVKFLVMDPGYRTENRQLIESNARRLNVPLTIFSSDIFESVFHIENSPVTCAPECGGGICTAGQGSWDATKLPWGIILTM